ncbi:hypothetical protein AN958_10240 [Leucoagaricus sp. SymC.cos]|nr:hypothetical protein AN958_10240 [Leucoagaricus sp. SymC.cos]
MVTNQLMNASMPDDSIVYKIENEVLKLVSAETLLQDKIKQLENELTVFKKAYTESNSEKTHLEMKCDQLKRDADRQKELFESQLQQLTLPKASRVVVLLDGDGAIFKPQLISSGQAGGRKAAALLLESIKEHVSSLGELHQFQTSVYIFFNKRGLAETLSRCGHPSARVRFEEFISGFNQATERFMMVDVGSDKEAADSKLRAFLEDEIRLPQTYKIIFGGCHDNGYVTTIRSHITSGFKHKLILLKSYSDNAAGFHDLDLPMFSVPNLFISQKLTASPSQTTTSLPKQFPSDPPTGDNLPPALSRGDVFHHFQPLSKQKPPPCTLFYLADNCKHGGDCRYAHDYILDASHYEEMRKNAKKSPCPATNRDEICTWGDDCCYGHTCPSGSKCPYYKAGKCKFVGGTPLETPKLPARNAYSTPPS